MLLASVKDRELYFNRFKIPVNHLVFYFKLTLFKPQLYHPKLIYTTFLLYTMLDKTSTI